MHYKVCGACAYYVKGSTPEMVREAFDDHSCKRRYPVHGMEPTMHPLEEASWVTAQLKRKGMVGVA